MPSVTVIWPDKNYEVSISADESETEWKFPRMKTPKKFALLMEFSPNIFNRGQNYSHLMFTSFTIGNGFLRVKFLEKLVIFFLSENVTINVRNIKAEDRYPDSLNSIPPSGTLYMNIFLGEDEGDLKYVSTINGTASTLKTDCKKVLRKLKLEPLDYMISLLDADTPRYSQYKAVMNVALRPIQTIKFKIGEEEQVVRYLPSIPKQHLIWTLNHLDSGNESQKSLKRRLLKISSNSGIPVDMLSGINGLGLSPDQFQRVCLPVNRWREFIKFVSEQLNLIPIDYARHDVGEDLSEADLRLQVWDRLLLSIVSEYKCLKSEFDLKKFINSKKSVIVDLALVSRSGKLPVLIFEISARCPSDGFPHKDFVKMISSMSQLCMDQAKELESRGKDPLQAKVFGVWVVGTSFQFCVATPEKRYNSTIGMDELFINISFNAHWKFDLVKPHGLSSADCPSSCCNQSEMRVIVKEASVAYSFPEQSLNADATLNIPEQEEVEPTALPKRKSKIPDEHEFNLKDVCVLKLFIDCAEKHMQTIDSLLNLPKIDPQPETIAITKTDAIITKSSSTSEKPTPKKLRANFSPGTTNAAAANAREMISELFYHGNGKIVLKKVPTQEIDVYEAIPALFKPYFPTLWDFYEERNEEDGKEAHVFVLERLEPFILDEGGYNAFFRAETFEQVILEAATMAVHVLFGLLILHEKAGFVHGDISPNNIMFSPQFGIWKLIDFDHSLPVEESLNRPRRSGTDGFRAPESIETGIYSPSSDVCSFGMVLETCICPFLAQYMKTGQQTHDLWAFKDLVSQLTRKDPAERLTVRAALDKFMKFVYSRPIPDFSIYGSTLLFPVAKDQLNCLPRATECPLEEEIPFSKITTNM